MPGPDACIVRPGWRGLARQKARKFLLVNQPLGSDPAEHLVIRLAPLAG
jgi:hypothetical protein